MSIARFESMVFPCRPKVNDIGQVVYKTNFSFLERLTLNFYVPRTLLVLYQISPLMSYK